MAPAGEYRPPCRPSIERQAVCLPFLLSVFPLEKTHTPSHISFIEKGVGQKTHRMASASLDVFYRFYISFFPLSLAKIGSGGCI